MRRVRALLAWARVTDDDGRLSLTHLALGVALWCTVRGVQVSWTEWAAVVVTLGAYHAKKYVASPPAPGSDTVDVVTPLLSRVATLEKMVSSIHSTATIERLRPR